MEFPIEIDCTSVNQLIEDSNSILLLDCREPDEVEICQISNSHWTPMREIPIKVEQLRQYADQNVIVYCHHGGRSLQVASWLRQQGFEKAQSMSGGIDQWAVAVDPQVPRY
jgi:rhodanese-related sulfurtransferase